MSRGIVSGAVTGIVVSLFAIVLLALVSPLPPAPVPPVKTAAAPSQAAPAPEASAAPAPPTEAAATTPAPAPEAPTVAPAPAAPTTAPAPEAQTAAETPAPAPATSEAAPVAESAVTPPAGSEFSKPRPDLSPPPPASDSAPAQGQVAQVATPEPAGDLPGTQTTAPGQMPQSGEAAPQGGAAPMAEAAPAALATAADADQAALPAAPAALSAPSGTVAPPVATASTDDLPPASAPQPATKPRVLAPPSDTAPNVVIPAPGAPLPGAMADAKPLLPGTSDAAPDAVADLGTGAKVLTAPGAVPAEKPQVQILTPDKPQVGLIGQVPGVVTDRLPQIGPSAPPTPAQQAAEAPLHRNAISFENPEHKPLLAVVLIDTGSSDLDRTAIARAAIPVTFAVDPTTASAEAAARLYRDGGHEVLVLANGIEADATPKDLEVNFAGYFSTVKEAVGLMDTAGSGFERNRTLSQRIGAILKPEGYGMVTYDRGLNAAAQVAAALKIPSVEIAASLRTPHGPDALNHTLDRLAFRAVQQGGLVVAAPASQAIITALQNWAMGSDHGRDVTFAPVSALFTNP